MKINRNLEQLEKLFFYIILTSILFILIYNIIHYTPSLGYDAEAHFAYVNHIARYLPDSLNLPSSTETREFFSPPLGYVVPAFGQVICRNVIESSDYLQDCQPFFAMFTHIFQSIMYLATLLINLLTIKLISNSKSIVNTSYILLISLLAVNYRTVSMIRGEPYILFFMSMFLFIILKNEKTIFKPHVKTVIITGLVIACIALSRQWGILLFPPLIVLLFLTRDKFKNNYFKFWFYSSTVGVSLSYWFYYGLYKSYGSFIAFNMDRTKFSFSNQEFSFYIPNTEHLFALFTNPIRPNLNNQFISILYSDLWGDYWGYFTFTSKYLDIGLHQNSIGSYLSRVNLVSLFVTIIILFFYKEGLKNFNSFFLIRYIKYAVYFSFFGFLVFSIAYVSDTGDVIKASYIIQLFHLIVFVASLYFHKLRIINKNAYFVTLFLLLVAYTHNFQSYLSNFPAGFYPQ